MLASLPNYIVSSILALKMKFSKRANCTTVLSSLLFVIISCTQEETALDQWITINPSKVSNSTESELNQLFFEDVNQTAFPAYRFDQNSLIILLNSQAELLSLQDTLERVFTSEVPEIDFDRYTLVYGEVITNTISDSLLSITFSVNQFHRTYRYDLTVFHPVHNWPMAGYIPFWQLYPKLPGGYRILHEEEHIFEEFE